MSTSPTMNSRGLEYLNGFANHFESEALQGALPRGGNSPRDVPMGLYAEQISGTAFTSVRAEGRRTWVYRRLPSVAGGAYETCDFPQWKSGGFADAQAILQPLRWLPLPGRVDADFIAGMFTIGANGSPIEQAGCAVHVYTADKPMLDRAMCNCDGELLIVPQAGSLVVQTELGWLEVAPGEVTLIPRGICFRVVSSSSRASGYVLENYGPLLRLPELGPIGANGLANPRHFRTPTAAYDGADVSFTVVTKFGGKFWRRQVPISPFNVVAWQGNLVPYKYDLNAFNVFGSVSYDSPDPSISTVLTSPSAQPGTAHVDFVVFPPRWQVAEGTFRPPYFHRNVMTEFMGLISGEYEGKREGFRPGGFSLHSCMAPHGPDQDTYLRGVEEQQTPNKLTGTMAFMFETRLPLLLNPDALTLPQLDAHYSSCWTGFPPTSVKRVSA